MRRSARKKRVGFRIVSKASLIRLSLLLSILLILSLGAWSTMFRMPKHSYQGVLPPLTAEEMALKKHLQQDVQTLAVDLGSRNYGHYPQLNAAKQFLEDTFTQMGYQPTSQAYKINNLTFPAKSYTPYLTVLMASGPG